VSAGTLPLSTTMAQLYSRARELTGLVDITIELNGRKIPDNQTSTLRDYYDHSTFGCIDLRLLNDKDLPRAYQSFHKS